MKKNSYLGSLPTEYHNDIVVAVTQASVNAAMREWLTFNNFVTRRYILAAITQNQQNVYMIVTPDTKPLDIPAVFPDSVRVDNLYNKLQALDLFTIPADSAQITASQREHLQTAYNDYYLDCAFDLKTGLPTFASPQTYKPINMNPTDDWRNGTVRFTQFFKDVTVIEIGSYHGSVSFTRNSQQAQGKAWEWAYTVPLCLDNAQYTPEVKKILMNHFHLERDEEVETMFDIAQLRLDLNAMASAGVPTIDGIEKETNPKLYSVVDEFVKDVAKDATIIGHIVAPKSANSSLYLFRPTDYRFSVSKSPNTNEEFKTLNYIISTSGEAPTPSNFAWSWVTPDASGEVSCSGIYAINRNAMFDKFTELFRTKVLNQLFVIPTAGISGNHKTIVQLCYSSSFSVDPSRNTSHYLYDADKNMYVYPTFSSSSDSGKISFYDPRILLVGAGTAQYKLSYTMTNTARWGVVTEDNVTYPGIVFETNAVLWGNVIFDSGENKGNLYNHTFTLGLGFKVDSNGVLTLIKTFSDKDNGKTIDTSAWSTFMSTGTTKDIVKDIDKWMNDQMSKVSKNFQDAFVGSWYGNSCWVIPGNRAFAFKNCAFSEKGDFCAEATYVEQN